MLDFFLAPQNMPFIVALVLMIFLAILEGVGAILGLGFSGLLRQIAPDSSFDFDVDMPNADASSAFGEAWSWLCVRRLPALVMFVLFLMAFGILGLMVQDCAYTFLGHLLPGGLASFVTMLLSIPVVQFIGAGLARILPGDETSVVSVEAFIGRTVRITLGVARPGYPSQGKLTDRHGLSHYVLVEPDQEGVEFTAGQTVLLVKHDGVKFYAIQADSIDVLRAQ